MCRTPKHRHVDAILELQDDDTWRPEGERAYVDDEADTSAFGSDDEIDMITGATISSRTVVAAINEALERVQPLVDAYRPEVPR